MKPKPSKFYQLVVLSSKAAALTEAACASCAKNDPENHCCNACARHNGYMHHLSDDDRAAVKLKYGWDEVRGFATNVGCRLPREIRSPVCLAFYCNPITQGLGNGPSWYQSMRDEKGFADAVLPYEIGKELFALHGPETNAGHERVVKRALHGRNSI